MLLQKWKSLVFMEIKLSPKAINSLWKEQKSIVFS